MTQGGHDEDYHWWAYGDYVEGACLNRESGLFVGSPIARRKA